MFHDEELLAHLHSKEIEKASREAWKFDVLKKEGFVQKAFRNIHSYRKNSTNINANTGNGNCNC